MEPPALETFLTTTGPSSHYRSRQNASASKRRKQGKNSVDTSNYVTLSRQAGLLKELQVLSNNVANTATTGFRAEGVVFAEMVQALPTEGGSVAMSDARVRFTDMTQGGLTETGGTYDLAIQGPGFFQIETPEGIRLTRAGAFTPNTENELVTFDGHRVLDAGGAPVFVPPDASSIAFAEDGTMTADGAPIAQMGVVTVDDPTKLVREGGILFNTDEALVPVEGTSILQGYLESANVNPVVEISRLIEVQRAYEMGQKFLDREDERVRAVIRTLGASR